MRAINQRSRHQLKLQAQLADKEITFKETAENKPVKLNDKQVAMARKAMREAVQRKKLEVGLNG